MNPRYVRAALMGTAVLPFASAAHAAGIGVASTDTRRPRHRLFGEGKFGLRPSTRGLLIPALLIAAPFMSVSSSAVGPPPGVRLTAFDALPIDIFGVGVAVRGNLAVVGAGGLECGPGQFNCGGAYVYRFNGSTWAFEQKLPVSDPLSQSGYDVAVDGDVILVNSWYADCLAGADCGAVYAYRYNGSSWVQEQKLAASDAAALDYFGNRLSLDGNVAVMGAYLDDCPGGADCGSAYVFRYNGASWIQEQKLTASDAAAGDAFGITVAVQGDTIMVGASGDDRPGAVDCGSVYVFHYNGAAWVQQQRINASDLGTGDNFGYLVSIDADTALISAPRDDIARTDDGSAYVFRNVAGTWVQEAKLTASDTCPRSDGGGHFGWSVSLSGDTAVVGAGQGIYGGTARGAAYLYRRSGSTWTQERELTPADAVVNDDVGQVVSVNGDWAFVGGWLDDSPSFDAGSVWIYRLHDCNDNGISDEIDIADCAGAPACGDCNGNTIPDGCEFVEGCAVDCNANGIPDECEGPPANDIVWDPTANPTPWPNNNPLATTRSLAFTVTGPPLPEKVDAIRVCMVDLQTPNPPNAPQFPPQNFHAWDLGSPAACASCTAETCPGNAGGVGGCCRWVGPWGTFYESQGPPLAGPSIAARLQCTPYYGDWKSKGPIWVVGAEIMPSSAYSVQAYAGSCMGNEATCTCPHVSAPVTMYTRRSGDVEAPYNPPTNVPQPNAIDLAQVVNKFKSVVGAPVKCRAQLQPNVPELNADVNAIDIVTVVDAIGGKAYPYAGPCPCPSLMTCGSLAPPGGTPCATPAVCVALPALSGGGAGAMCVKTCKAPATNAGEPCINDAHCPGGGVGSCGNGGATPGFCRDKCGRCN